MTSFTSSLSLNSDAIAIFVDEKYRYKDKKKFYQKILLKKIDSFLAIKRNKKKEDEIISFDISDKQKCFIVKVKNKYESFLPRRMWGAFFFIYKKIKRIYTQLIYILIV